MAKLIIAVLVIILLVLGFIFVSSRGQPSLPSVGSQPTSAPATITSQSAPEDDLTALDKELGEMESSEADFSQELNSL